MNSAFFKENRRRMLETIGNGVLVIPASPECTFSNDVTYPYRQNSDLRYLTGFTEPEAVLVLAPQHEHPYTLFVRPRDLEKEIWNGFRQGVDGAKENFGADAAYPISELSERLPGYLADVEKLYYTFGQSHFDETLMAALQGVRAQVRNGVNVPEVFHDPHLVLGEMRLIKQPYEIEVMRKAADISVEAHLEIMKQLKPGMYEYEIAALIDYIFGKNRSRMGYPAIVGGGVNATILHYIENDAELREGELLLTDAGAEYDYYTGDITRTIPVGKAYTPAQKALYEVVLAAQLAAVDTVQPGNHFRSPHEKAVQVLTEGLVELGLLKGSVEELIASEAYTQFYMHKTGHWLGSDVHDVGAYKNADGSWRTLEAGMVLTVEPGLYVGPHLKGKVPAEFENIGVRIEDDILVTETGFDNLTEGVPKGIAEIEALRAAAY